MRLVRLFTDTFSSPALPALYHEFGTQKSKNLLHQKIEVAIKMAESNAYEIVADYLLRATKYRPVIGIICGSGLSGLSKSLENPVSIHYHDIPGFPEATVPGHSGELVFGTMDGIEVVCMRGRFHYYEGNDMSKVVLPVRAMRLIGVKLLVVTNAAGALNKSYKVGDIVVIQDHFGAPLIAGNHPLRGINDDFLGPRFPSVSDAYDTRLQSIIVKCAQNIGAVDDVKTNGTYCYVSGPAYESRAESRFLRSIGGDCVGMSTIPEVITAKHCGMKILGLSFMTNKVIIEQNEGPPASHQEVLEAVEKSGAKVEKLVKSFITKSNLQSILDEVPALEYKSKSKCPVKNHTFFGLALTSYMLLTMYVFAKK